MIDLTSKIPANKRPGFLDAAVPAATGLIFMLPPWIISYLLATPVTLDGFMSFWFGAMSIILGIGAIASTIVAIVGSAIAAHVILK